MHKRSWCRRKVRSKATIKSYIMACENGRASGCTPASASEKSLKVDLYRMAKSQLFHPLTTWGSMHALIRTWLTTFWCAPCMPLLATMIFDHRCQLPPDLNHYCFDTCNFPNLSTFNPYQYRNTFSKYLYSCTAFFFTSKENLFIGYTVFRRSKVFSHFITC